MVLGAIHVENPGVTPFDDDDLKPIGIEALVVNERWTRSSQPQIRSTYGLRVAACSAKQNS